MSEQAALQSIERARFDDLEGQLMMPEARLHGLVAQSRGLATDADEC
jgi:hypothetical protein